MVALVRKWPWKVLHQIAYLEGGLELAFFKTVHRNHQIAYLEGGLEVAFFKTVHSNQTTVYSTLLFCRDLKKEVLFSQTSVVWHNIKVKEL